MARPCKRAEARRHGSAANGRVVVVTLQTVSAKRIVASEAAAPPRVEHFIRSERNPTEAAAKPKEAD